jgi:hypothetical protein
MSDDKIPKYHESIKLIASLLELRLLISLLNDRLHFVLEEIGCNEKLEQVCSLSDVILEKSIKFEEAVEEVIDSL